MEQNGALTLRPDMYVASGSAWRRYWTPIAAFAVAGRRATATNDTTAHMAN